MNYFSGFSLQGEQELFGAYLTKQAGVVAGFSYGAQQALAYALKSTKRIERLVLLSPAFFQTQKPSFKRAQLRYFDTGKEAYVSQFLRNVAYPSKVDLTPYVKVGTREALDALLHYEWDAQHLRTLQKRGVCIEVFLGGKDKIIDADAAYDFFAPLATTYFIKEAGHLLAL